MKSKIIFSGFITITAFLILMWAVTVGATIRVMPLGDSITRGCCPLESGCDLGYRYPLYQKLAIEEAIYLNFVGSQKHPQDSCSLYGVPIDFDRDHEGYYGQTADEIYDNLYTYFGNNPPDIVLLHIGTNDIRDGQPISQIVSEVSGILNRIDTYESAYHRNVTVLLALIINSVPYNSTITQYNNALKVMAQNRINSGDDLIIVDMEHDAGIVY